MKVPRKLFNSTQSLSSSSLFLSLGSSLLEIIENTLSRNCSSFNKIFSASDRFIGNVFLSLEIERVMRRARIERGTKATRKLVADSRQPSCLIAVEEEVGGRRQRKESAGRKTKLLLNQSTRDSRRLLCCTAPV